MVSSINWIFSYYLSIFLIESFRKTSANSAFEKARAFFRSLDFKHHHRHEQPNQDNTITITDPPSSNDDDQKQDLLLKSIPSITNISITRIPRVEKTNSQDIIINNDNKLSSNYFQQKYKQYLKPSLLIPKQYYNDILNKRYQTYSTFINRYGENRKKIAIIYRSFLFF